MPTFQGEEAVHYDNRITRLVPGYELLHQLTTAQLQVLLPEQARILVVGAGTGKELMMLASQQPQWQFVAQDISADMLAIAHQAAVAAKVDDRITFLPTPLVRGQRQYDAVLCLLVLHFLPDNGDKADLLAAMASQLKVGGQLFLADLMAPHSGFEREAQLTVCKTLGLSDVGVERMRHNLTHEFYPLDNMRLAELLDNAGFDTAKPYFQALGFAAITSRALP